MTLFSSLRLDQELIELIGWTIIHAVWQMSLIGITAAIVLRQMKQASASSRYWTALFFLALMVMAPVATCCFHPAAISSETSTTLPHAQPDGLVPPAIPVGGSRGWAPPSEVDSHRIPDAAADVAGRAPAVHRPSHAEAEVTEPGPDILSAITRLIRPWMPGIVSCWLIGAVCFATRPVFGWVTLRQLRQRGLNPVPEMVRRLFESTAERLGIRSPGTILLSDRITSPVIIGWLRPLVLLPATAITGLTDAQLKAIIAHELAHLRRHDFPVNIIQTVIETVFFFHPAIWWLSRRIRVEREHCCDDLVVSTFLQPSEYGRALLAIAEMQGGASVLALGAADGSLSSRVKRLFNSRGSQEPKPAGILVLIAVVCVLAVAVSGMAWFQGTSATSPGSTADTNDTMPDSELQAWKSIFAMDAHLIGPAAHQEHLLQHADFLERTGYPDRNAIQKYRRDGSKPIREINLFNAPPDVWQHLLKLKSGRVLNLTATEMTPELWRAIGQMTWLTEISMVNNRAVYPSDLRHLSRLTNLRRIAINMAGNSLREDERRERMGQLSTDEIRQMDRWMTDESKANLKSLQIAILTDRAMASLSELKNLRVLRLYNTTCTERGLQAMSEFRKMEELHLNVASTEKRAGRIIGGWKHLKSISGLSLSDEMIEQFAGLNKLEHIDAWGGDVTFASVDTLAEFPVLKSLGIRGCQLTRGDLDRLLETRAVNKRPLKKLDLSHNKLISKVDSEYLKDRWKEVEFRFSDELPDVVVGSKGRISGTVEDEHGTVSADDTIVRYHLKRSAGSHDAEATSGNLSVTENRFAHELGCGELTLVAYRTGFAPSWTGPVSIKPGASLENLRILLNRGSSQVVQVFEADGHTMSDAIVWAMPVINGNTDGFIRKQFTDISGYSCIPNLADTRHVFHVELDGRALKTEDIALNVDSVLKLMLPRHNSKRIKVQQADIRRDEVTISGVALDNGKRPVAEANVYLTSQSFGGSIVARTRTDDSGRYRFSKIRLPVEPETLGDGAPVAQFEVFGMSDKHGFTWRAQKRFYPDTEISGHETRWSLPDDPPHDFGPTDHISLDLHFESAAVFRGNVVDTSGQPVSRAKITILSVEPLPDKPIRTYSEFTGVGPSDFRSIQSAATVPAEMRARSTNTAGEFEFRNLPGNCEFRLRIDPPAGLQFDVVYASTGPADLIQFSDPKVHLSGATLTLKSSD